jgi:IS5 family transposase
MEANGGAKMKRLLKQMSFLAEDDRLSRLSQMGDPLEAVNTHIDFEMFRATIEHAIKKQGHDPRKGGRPPFDAVLMWKMSLLQERYGISNGCVEYMVNDRLSFQRFLGLSLGDKVPDANTLWDFKEALAKQSTDTELFCLFEAQMEAVGLITRKGSIVDATFVDAPRQRNTRDENRTVKEGGIPDEWTEPEQAHKRAQKDTDARWAKKNNETHYGYKDHVKVDTDSKMIVSFEVTDASVHDSQAIVALCDEGDEVIYADSAYVGDELVKTLLEKCGVGHVRLEINEKGCRNHPLTELQKASNREKSRIRVRVEHVFGFMTVSMGGIFIRTIGLVRARAGIARRNLAYNLKRYTYLAPRMSET